MAEVPAILLPKDAARAECWHCGGWLHSVATRPTAAGQLEIVAIFCGRCRLGSRIIDGIVQAPVATSPAPPPDTAA